MPKAAEAFRTISEVADDLEIPKHVLRFWEVKFTHIRPMKRGGGRRYYRPEDMELLRGIRYLLHREGYTIKGVQKILKEQGVEAVKVHGKSDEQDTPAVQPAPAAATASVISPPKRESAKPAAAIGTAAPSSGVARRELIRRAITELEACRSQLGGRPRQPAQAATASTRKIATGS